LAEVLLAGKIREIIFLWENMMSLEIWIPFALASSLILVIPGPTIILVISQAVSHGRWSVLPLAIGVVLGDFTAMMCSFLGLGVLLSTSAALFVVFKWVGALYLMYLGIKLWRSTPDNGQVDISIQRASAGALLKRSFIVTALNPKSIAFFVAFLPQFIDPLQPAGSQLTVLGGTFLILAGLNAALYAAFAGRLSQHIRKTKVRKWFDRCGGTALIGAGVITAGIQRSA
jgi:threonine/homoserine/homoserine lactone efflux protein